MISNLSYVLNEKSNNFYIDFEFLEKIDFGLIYAPSKPEAAITPKENTPVTAIAAANRKTIPFFNIIFIFIASLLIFSYSIYISSLIVMVVLVS